MASFNVSELPNPTTPLAFLPPDIAHQVEITHYILVGTLGAYVWDILCNLHNDHKLLFSTKISIGTGVYFFSRVFSLLYILGVTLLITYPLHRCALGQLLSLVCFALAVSANSFLFFLRARAIFDRNRLFVLFLFITWLSVVGTAGAAPAGVVAQNLGPNGFCLTVSAKGYVGGVGVTPLIHDTIVFLAISWRLFQNSHVNRGLTTNARAFVTGEYLPQFSKAILQDGQLYYLLTVTTNLLTVIMFYNTAVAETYRTMFTTCNVMVTNVMACHVFRNTKFGYQNRVVTTSQLVSRETGATIIMHRRQAQSNGNGILSGGPATSMTVGTVELPNAQYFPGKKESLA